MEIILTSWAPQDTVKFVKCPEWGTEGEGGVCEGGGSATPEYSRLIGDPPAKKTRKINWGNQEITFWTKFYIFDGASMSKLSFVDKN